MIKRFSKYIFLLALNLNLTFVYASTIYSANNGDTISATISANSLTRITVAGELIVKDFTTANLSSQIVPGLGQVYLTPNTLKTFTLYIVTNRGNTYNLRLTPSKNAVGDSIVIKPKLTQVSYSSLKFNSGAYVRNINNLIELMYLNQDGAGFNKVNNNTLITTFTDLESVLLKTYESSDLIGEVLLLKNVSKNPILLTESEFYSLHTLAVAIETPELKPNQYTRVFIVRSTT